MQDCYLHLRIETMVWHGRQARETGGHVHPPPEKKMTPTDN